jgi:hypothetical protein
VNRPLRFFLSNLATAPRKHGHCMI